MEEIFVTAVVFIMLAVIVGVAFIGIYAISGMKYNRRMYNIFSKRK